MFRETNKFPPHITFPAIASPRHSTHPTIPIFDPFTVLFPSNPGGLFLPLRIMSAWASPGHFGCKRLTERGPREDEQHWECISTTQSAAQAAGRRSKGESEQVSSTPDAPGSAAEKTAGVATRAPSQQSQPLDAAAKESGSRWDQR